MSFTVAVPEHQQDAFAETVDQVVQTSDTAPGTIPLSTSDLNLRDYLVRKVKEMLADAPIVGERLVASISGHANDGAAVFDGTGTAPNFAISVQALAPVVPEQQQPQTTATHGGTFPVPAAVDAPSSLTPTQGGPSTTTEDESAEATEEAGEPADPTTAPAASTSTPATSTEPPVDPTGGASSSPTSSAEPVQTVTAPTHDSQPDPSSAPLSPAPAEASAAPAAATTPASQSDPLTKWSSNVPAGGVSAEDASQHLTEAPPSAVPDGTVPPAPGTPASESTPTP